MEYRIYIKKLKAQAMNNYVAGIFSIILSSNIYAYQNVNSQITGSITQTNTKVLGEAPAIATGNLYIANQNGLTLNKDCSIANETNHDINVRLENGKQVRVPQGISAQQCATGQQLLQNNGMHPYKASITGGVYRIYNQ